MTGNLLDPAELANARAERRDGRISATYWLPRIAKAGLPVPRTAMVPYDHGAAIAVFEDGSEQARSTWDPAREAVEDAANRIGFPVFVRTDITSAKHDGPEAYRADDAKGLDRVLYRTVADTEMKVWLTGPRPQAIMVREWLSLVAPFAAFGGHLIGREWRIFTGADGKVACSHFYWPEEALDGHVETAGWQEALTALSRRPQALAALQRMAEVAARVCDDHGQAWSVDFAQSDDRRWWLIDMAPAHVSYHVPGCENERPNP